MTTHKCIAVYFCYQICPSNTRLLINSISHKSQKKCVLSIIMYSVLLRLPQDVRTSVLMRMINRCSTQNCAHLMIGRIFYRLAFGSVQFKIYFSYFPHTSSAGCCMGKSLSQYDLCIGPSQYDSVGKTSISGNHSYNGIAQNNLPI